MADEYIRKLTHDDEQFDRQWSTIFSRINNLFIECEEKNIDIPSYKVKILNALVNYVVVEAKNPVKNMMMRGSCFRENHLVTRRDVRNHPGH